MKKEIAERFGKYLDEDNFEEAKKLLAANCEYKIGAEVIRGPELIMKSYEDNMVEGRNKLDELQWGKSWIEQQSEDSYIVNFTDYLKHKGVSHIHKCKQILRLNEVGSIIQIEHVNNQEEEATLKKFYEKVGLK